MEWSEYDTERGEVYWCWYLIYCKRRRSLSRSGRKEEEYGLFLFTYLWEWRFIQIDDLSVQNRTSLFPQATQRQINKLRPLYPDGEPDLVSLRPQLLTSSTLQVSGVLLSWARSHVSVTFLSGSGGPCSPPEWKGTLLISRTDAGSADPIQLQAVWTFSRLEERRWWLSAFIRPSSVREVSGSSDLLPSGLWGEKRDHLIIIMF